MDTMTKRQRSRLMSRIRSSGTKPEKVCRRLFRALTKRRLRYNDASLPGSPDIVIPSIKVAFFADGCYWHVCPVHGRVPKSNVAFWTAKLRRNVARDKSARRALRKMGWTVWCIWEHDLKEPRLPGLRRRIRRRLSRIEGSLSRVSFITGTNPVPTEIQMSTKTAAKTTTKKTTPAKKATTKKATTKKAPARKPAKKATAKKPTARKPAKKSASKMAAKKSPARKPAKPAAPSSTVNA